MTSANTMNDEAPQISSLTSGMIGFGPGAASSTGTCAVPLLATNLPSLSVVTLSPCDSVPVVSAPVVVAVPSVVCVSVSDEFGGTVCTSEP